MPHCRDETIRQLQQKADVLLRAKAAVERRLTNDLAAERRAAIALRQQMKAMQVGRRAGWLCSMARGLRVGSLRGVWAKWREC